MENFKKLIHQLKTVKLPDEENQLHRYELRRQLLCSKYFDQKGGEKNMNIKRFALSGLVIAVLVAGVFAFTSLKQGSSTVYAKELAQKTYQAVSALPADQQVKVSATVGFDSRTALQEAYNAKDLKGMSYEEFASANPVPPDPDGKLKSLKFLEYTNKDGAIVVIGVDPVSNLPTFGSVRYGNPENPPKDAQTIWRNEKGLHTSPEGETGKVNCTVENGKEICK